MKEILVFKNRVVIGSGQSALIEEYAKDHPAGNPEFAKQIPIEDTNLEVYLCRGRGLCYKEGEGDLSGCPKVMSLLGILPDKKLAHVRYLIDPSKDFYVLRQSAVNGSTHWGWKRFDENDDGTLTGLIEYEDKTPAFAIFGLGKLSAQETLALEPGFFNSNSQ